MDHVGRPLIRRVVGTPIAVDTSNEDVKDLLDEKRGGGHCSPRWTSADPSNRWSAMFWSTILEQYILLVVVRYSVRVS